MDNDKITDPERSMKFEAHNVSGNHDPELMRKIEEAIDAYEAHTNQEPPTGEAFWEWHAEAIRLLDKLNKLAPERETAMEKLLREASGLVTWR
jgi:hypothetical protein